ncbi:fluoride efflux transporter CrcB [Thermoanaerobacter sp. CM-CNRG TB177]|uniref:fluoride efflux transporter CrcB n=1 Tax=Thermoanaerobacter sp. CM-CNRG TB177 TaxID=2800659 RepID=UPI001BDE23A5|nr:fluoride efflux transporter CrcB [Thermoanaerobacter sp. CM-CNRG TB177]MBT1279424.1 fluoride efflux transporter CrcB [Thermoanaerobacter sp. CM-CNRG TB177]
MEYIYMGVGGFFGAVLRYLITIYFTKMHHTVFPIETFMINILGSFLLSFITNFTMDKYKINTNLRLAITTGFIGAFTTFSTFSMETINLLKAREIYIALNYVILSIIGGLLMSYLGFEFADKIFEFLEEREKE